MNNLWPEYKWQLIGAAIGATFHFCTVVLVLVITGGSGEGQGGLVLLLDFPLVIFLQAIPNGNIILYGPVLYYIFFFSLFGTAMYAVIGWLVGDFLGYIRRKLR